MAFPGRAAAIPAPSQPKGPPGSVPTACHIQSRKATSEGDAGAEDCLDTSGRRWDGGGCGCYGDRRQLLSTVLKGGAGVAGSPRTASV